jgi:hypothetical protein
VRLLGNAQAAKDVPLGETYRIEIYDGEKLVRRAEVGSPAFAYEAAAIAADFPGGRPPLTIRVAQISDLVGVGGWGRWGLGEIAMHRSSANLR